MATLTASGSHTPSLMALSAPQAVTRLQAIATYFELRMDQHNFKSAQ